MLVISVFVALIALRSCHMLYSSWLSILTYFSSRSRHIPNHPAFRLRHMQKYMIGDDSTFMTMPYRLTTALVPLPFSFSFNSGAGTLSEAVLHTDSPG